MIRCRLYDDTEELPTANQWQDAVRSAEEVAKRVRAGERVLVTCAMGINRSGLVCALSLHMLMGWSGARCVRYIQSKRPIALKNPIFVGLLEGIR